MLKDFKLGEPYTESPDWIKNKKATTNEKKKDDRCFCYATTIALNVGEIKKDPQRISNIKPFMNKHNWYGMKYL